MRNIAFLVILLTIPAQAQEQSVSFVHGLNGDETSWAYAADYLENKLLILPTNAAYASNSSNITTIAQSYYSQLPTNTVVVAHSMGGLVSREMIRQHGTNDKIKALITVGSPHIGAEAANVPGSNRFAALTSWWTADLAEGIFRLFHVSSYAEAAALEALSPLFDYFQFFVDVQFGGPATDDMKPGSSFLQTLNSSPGSTLPAAHYAVWGGEDWNMHWRLADAAAHNGVESGNYIQIEHGLEAFYIGSFISATIVAQVYANLIGRARTFAEYMAYYEAYQYWQSVAEGFFIGFRSLNSWQQRDWDALVTGALQGGTEYSSDGIVPVFSQVPSFINSSRYLYAPGVNHLEERKNQVALDQIEIALRKGDIGIDPRPEPAPLYADIGGGTYVGIGYTGTWYADASGGKTPYSYRWQYMVECALGSFSTESPLSIEGGAIIQDLPCDQWVYGGTGSSMSLRRTSEATVHLKLTVDDSSIPEQTKTTSRTVYFTNDPPF